MGNTDRLGLAMAGGDLVPAAACIAVAVPVPARVPLLAGRLRPHRRCAGRKVCFNGILLHVSWEFAEKHPVLWSSKGLNAIFWAGFNGRALYRKQAIPIVTVLGMEFLKEGFVSRAIIWGVHHKLRWFLVRAGAAAENRARQRPAAAAGAAGAERRSGSRR